MRKELTKESEEGIINPEEVQEKEAEKQEPKQEPLTALEVLDVAEGNLIRALNAIRMLKQ